MTKIEVQILIIEDNEEHATLLARLLESAGDRSFESHIAHSLAEGVHILRQQAMDLVLLDLSLPDSVGVATFTAVSKAAPHVPVVVLSGLGDVSLALEVVQNGAQDYLVKGHVDNHLLLRSVQYAIERKRVQVALQQAREQLEARVSERTSALVDANAKLQVEIAERKKAEENALESNRKLVDALEAVREMQQELVRKERFQALGHMASGIAHEFNNVLTPILGYTEHLLKSPAVLADREQTAGFLEKIRLAAESGAGAVARVRDFARAEAGELGPVGVHDLVESALALTEPKWAGEALAKGVSITIVRALEEVRDVFGDAAQLRELLTHLIFNAVEAIRRRGRIAISAKSVDGEVVLKVEDDGSGMSAELLARCLDAGASLTPIEGRLPGYGLVHRTVARHKGRLEIVCKVGAGTTVIVYLPALEPTASSVVLPAGNEPEPSVAAAPGALRMLVVDDEPMVREVVSICLEDAGYVVETAENGREGWEKFQAAEYDLVLTDRSMPEMNGDELALEVKRLRPSVPVILLTGFGDLMNSEGEKPPGIAAVVAKPFTMAALNEVVRKLMKQK